MGEINANIGLTGCGRRQFTVRLEVIYLFHEIASELNPCAYTSKVMIVFSLRQNLRHLATCLYD